MLEKISVSIELDIVYDTILKSFSIKKNTATINNPHQPNIIKMSRTLQPSEIQYGILTLGSKSPIGRILPLNQDIVVIFNGLKYQAHSHKSSHGRLDRLSSLVKNFQAGTQLDFEYNIQSKKLNII